MPIENYDLVGSYNNQRFTGIDAERSVNLFIYLDPLGKKDKSLITTSGLLNTGINFTGAIGGFRAELVLNQQMHFVVIGQDVFLINSSNIPSKINTSPLATNNGYVGIEANNATQQQIIFVDGAKGYLYNVVTGAWTPDIKAVDPNFPVNPIDVCNIDGFFIVASGGTNLFVMSQLNNGLSYTVAGVVQQGQINSHYGPIVACRTLHRLVFFFSNFYTEVWENAGAAGSLPIRRNNSYLIEYGTPAIGSIQTGFDKMFFLSQDRDGLGSVMEVVGAQATPVSSRALDFQLAQYAANPLQGVSDCRALLVKENGLIFYRMNFTAAQHTFVYNVSMSDPGNEVTMRWHEEEMLDGTRHVAQTHGYFNGRNYVGHYAEPILYYLDPNTYTNDGEAIRRMRIGKAYCPPGYQRIRIDRFQIDLLQGSKVLDFLVENEFLLAENGDIILTEDDNDILTEQQFTTIIDQDAILFFSYSKDGGQTYGTEFPLPMGESGERTFRTLIRKLGTTKRGQSFVPKVEFFNSVPFIILGAAWFYEVLPE